MASQKLLSLFLIANIALNNANFQVMLTLILFGVFNGIKLEVACHLGLFHLGFSHPKRSGFLSPFHMSINNLVDEWFFTRLRKRTKKVIRKKRETAFAFVVLDENTFVLFQQMNSWWKWLTFCFSKWVNFIKKKLYHKLLLKLIE